MRNNPHQPQSGSGVKDVGKTAAGVALGLFSVPVIAAIVIFIFVLTLCVICVVLGGGFSFLASMGG